MISLHLVLPALLLFSSCLFALEQEEVPFSYEDDEVFMQLILRSPEQLNAFYIGREFPQAAIDKILETCFVAAIIKNKSLDVLWLELDEWVFTVDGEAIPRFKRNYWKERWQEAGLPQAHQSTFGWTLMPEQRDLRLDEGVGGNVAIPIQVQPFTLTANFRTGRDKQGKPKSIDFEGVPCLSDKQ